MHASIATRLSGFSFFRLIAARTRFPTDQDHQASRTLRDQTSRRFVLTLVFPLTVDWVLLDAQRIARCVGEFVAVIPY
jgi:hypothetical protein